MLVCIGCQGDGGGDERLGVAGRSIVERSV